MPTERDPITAPLVVATTAERPDLAARADGIAEIVWPEYNRHGDVLNQYWLGLEERFADVQFVVYDPDDDVILAEGHTIPCRWDGTADGLPAGIDGVIAQGFDLADRGERPNTLSALAIEILPAYQGRGLSRVLIETMRAIAARHGLTNLIAPVRPNWKERYPLAAIERYAAWTTPEGLPFDPWMRVHSRLGADILRPEPHSLRITGTVGEWERWVALRFPESGDYVFPHGLAPLSVDLEANRGAYWEPNVWMRHPVR